MRQVAQILPQLEINYANDGELIIMGDEKLAIGFCHLLERLGHETVSRERHTLPRHHNRGVLVTVFYTVKLHTDTRVEYVQEMNSGLASITGYGADVTNKIYTATHRDLPLS